eukprot:7141755-Pyramimonas_sp.AAC.1
MQTSSQLIQCARPSPPPMYMCARVYIYLYIYIYVPGARPDVIARALRPGSALAQSSQSALNRSTP